MLMPEIVINVSLVNVNKDLKVVKTNNYFYLIFQFDYKANGKTRAKKRERCSSLVKWGIDSTACIHYYSNLGFSVNALFIDYNQKSKYQEFLSAKMWQVIMVLS